jgi:hypothetical protein
MTDPTGLFSWSVVGATIGAVVGVIVAAVFVSGRLVRVLPGIGLVLGASLAITGVCYVIASNVDSHSGLGQFIRGFMIGSNAGMNSVLASVLFGPAVGTVIGVIGFLSAFDGLAHNSVYKGILGWTSWIMPMSWGATGLGTIFCLLNLANAVWDPTKIDKVGIDGKTGSVFMSGGWITGPSAFDMGNFVFINPNYVDGSTPDQTFEAVLAHETGHTLAVAAFGTAFGLFDLLNENVLGAGEDDYGERIAESNVPGTIRPHIPMWGGSWS